jgi:predicted RNase H-like nuclease
MFVGVDGCRAGWFAVTLTPGPKWRVQVFANISSLWHECGGARLILVDVPIGLRDSGFSERQCDKLARKLLGRPRRSSVFPVPCRGAAYADAGKASDINKRLTGRRLSRQTLGITQKIQEVDRLLADDNKARSVMKEVHPELCFWALNGRAPMEYRKKDGRGSLERKRLLRTVCSFTDDLLRYALEENRGKVAEDDIIDALVAALTASKGMRGLSFVPDPPEMDSTGLPMHMAYYALPPATLARSVV